ncbi:DUF228 domain-containing protein [Borreliella bavariensis]|uniref:DUF228 domain-containing protein n=1 Tax=Borreliella bavariensis TaxID=664662 RepID=UPI00165E0DFF|nr:DUF228 domain-containing protein [Borreliella bavariensis]
MAENTAQLVKEYQEKRSKLEKLMKNPQKDSGLLTNSLEFRDKNIEFFASGGTKTSKYDKLENHSFVGYPYKRGVKIVIQEAKSNEPHYEPHVEAGGGEDLYGICTDIDEFTGIATVIPITNNFEGYLVCKKDSQSSINVGDKLNFDQHGELEKASGSNKTINAIALSKAHKLTENLYIILASVFGNRAKGN